VTVSHQTSYILTDLICSWERKSALNSMDRCCNSTFMLVAYRLISLRINLYRRSQYCHNGPDKCHV